MRATVRGRWAGLAGRGVLVAAGLAGTAIAAAAAPGDGSASQRAVATTAMATWQGRVVHDRDRDGIAGPREQGIPGVRVSNGVDLATTDAAGRWQLPARAGAEVFVIKPAGWQPGRDANGLPAHWRAPGDGDAAIDFALQPAPRRRGPLRARLFADPQVKDMAEVDFYRHDIVAPLLATGHGAALGDLGLTLGDLVDDVPALYPALDAVTTSMGLPWLHAAGNHDVDAGAGDADATVTFRRRYGPDTFAWEEPEATFVVLDDVISLPGQRPAYVGGFRADQFAFLERYLAQAPRDRLLVLAVHIPFFDVADAGRPETFRRADRERLFALLRPFPKVLLLSAHGHVMRQHFHDADDGWHGATPLRELNLGAACGAYWSGVADADGIPDSTMADGTPNGTGLLEVRRGGDYAIEWLPARQGSGDPATTPFMALHAPKVLRRGAYPAWGVYANVWLGHAGTRVEYRVDGGDWQPMARVHAPDPRLAAENARDDAATSLRGHDRSPEADPSTHLWRGALPTRIAAGEHEVEVRAFDDWQGEQRARIRYRLDDASR